MAKGKLSPLNKINPDDLKKKFKIPDLKSKFKISIDTTEVDEGVKSLQERIDKLGDSWGDL